jgi:hypothetical protein
LPFSITSADASTIAVPVAVIEREPPVPLLAADLFHVDRAALVGEA